MQQTTFLKTYLEIFWWLFTLIVMFVVMTPIANAVPGFPFFGTNALFIICFITFARYIFLLKHSWLARMEWVKVLILGGAAILIFILATSLGDFNSFVREVGLQELVLHLPVARQQAMIRYMHNEMIFFGVGAILSAAILPVRMLISIWRGRNTGGV